MDDIMFNEVDFDTDDFENSDRILIQIVERFPILYDKSNSEYKEQLKKENAWLAIAGALQRTVDEVQRDWERIRRRYTKTRREANEPPKSGSAATNMKVWPLFRCLQFLDAHVASRRTTGNASALKTKVSAAVPGPSSQSSSPWDPFAPGMPLELTQQQNVNEHRNSSSSYSSSLFSHLNLHSTSQPILTPCKSSTHRPIPTSSPSPATTSNSLPASRMSTPDAFHHDKRQKVDSFETFLRTQLAENNSAIQQLKQNRPLASDNADKHFANYMCELFKSVTLYTED